MKSELLDSINRSNINNPELPDAAFPNDTGTTYEGMGLRDYFAVRVMQALIPGNINYDSVIIPIDGVNTSIEKIWAGIAEQAYSMADAMLKERKK